MRLKLITITGADNSVKPSELLELSKEFPFVEWGLLLSKKQMGSKRFPSRDWFETLAGAPESDGIQLAGHLCGSWLRNLMEFGDDSFKHEIPIWSKLKRIQLNFHGEPTTLKNSLQTLRNLCWQEHKHFILQMDGVNNDLYPSLNYAGVLVNGLYDMSHGLGVLPTEWPKEIPSINPKDYRGYAGGLNHLNLSDELHKISKTVGDITVWVDMETGVRSNNDTQFDLDKVRKCLEIAKFWV